MKWGGEGGQWEPGVVSQHLLELVGEQDMSFTVPCRCLHGPRRLGQPERQRAPGLAGLRGAGLRLRLELQ